MKKLMSNFFSDLDNFETIEDEILFLTKPFRGIELHPWLTVDPREDYG